jgi:Leucine-rich repeat (LRR) protein
MHLRAINELTFSNISLCNIVALDLEYTRIEMITEGAFRKMTSLKYLNMNNNRWLNLASWRQVFSLPALQELSLKRCKIPLQFVAKQVNKILTLKSLWLSRNIINMARVEFEEQGELWGEYIHPTWFETFSNLTGDVVLNDLGIRFIHTNKPCKCLL